jgi:hypothetical protein
MSSGRALCAAFNLGASRREVKEVEKRSIRIEDDPASAADVQILSMADRRFEKVSKRDSEIQVL